MLFKPKKNFLERGPYNYCLLQRGNGYYEDSEDSQSSQETPDSSQSSQETDSSQEVIEHLNPWSRILDEAQDCHEVQLDTLVDEYKRNGDSENVAHLKEAPYSFLTVRELISKISRWRELSNSMPKSRAKSRSKMPTNMASKLLKFVYRI